MKNNIGKPAYWAIIVLSVSIPLAVTFLIFMDGKAGTDPGNWVKALPHLNAVLNSITTIALIFGLVVIKKKNVPLHKLAMTVSFFLGTLFLISYVTYHASVPSVVYGDLNGDGILSSEEALQSGSGRSVYLALLLSHIGLSIVVVPFVLMAFYYALSKKVEQHKKIVKFTWPIWFYVSISGVFVYLMISPFYR